MPRRPRGQAASLIELTRPQGGLILAALVFLGQVMALGRIPDFPQWLFPSATAFLLTSASFVINDYADYEIDKINAPTRPIPSGRVNRRTALAYGAALSVLGLLALVPVNPSAKALAAVSYAVSLLYSFRGKKTGLLGNILVSYCISINIVFGSVSASGATALLVVNIFAAVFFFNLGNEVNNGILDMEGDASKGVRSLAVVRGPRAAAAFASACFLLAFLTGELIAINALGFDALAVVVGIAGALLISLLASHYIKNPTRQVASIIHRQSTIWVFGILSVIMILSLI